MDKKKFENIMYHLWFVNAMGTRRATARDIYRNVGNVEKLFRANRADLKQYGIKSDEVIEALMNKDLSKAESEMWFANNYNVSFLTMDAEDYPKNLRAIHAPPLLLYVRGDHFKPNEELYVSIIGTKRCSRTGEETAYRLARELACEGVTVVGGLSDGIEKAAHEGALSVGGKTTAALVSGVNKVYPRGNKELMFKILNSGAVISEYAFETGAFAGNFAERNRIIAGISVATVLVESAVAGNSIKTARLAFDSERDVFAVPGDIKNPNAEGPNELIKTIAKPITKAKDLIEEYENIYPGLIRASKFNMNSIEFDMPQTVEGISADELAVINSIREFPKTIDEIAAKVQKPISAVNGIITLLEMKDKIKRTSQNTYTLK